MKAEWNRTIPVISTGHVKRDTQERLETVLALVAAYENGFFLYLCEEGETDQVVTDELFPELVPVRRWFNENYPGERWISFDADGDPIEELPFNDW